MFKRVGALLGAKSIVQFYSAISDMILGLGYMYILRLLYLKLFRDCTKKSRSGPFNFIKNTKRFKSNKRFLCVRLTIKT